MELRLFNQTSGVGAALLGTPDAGGKSNGVEHFEAQVESATIALADTFRTFRAMIEQRDKKLTQLLIKPLNN